MNKQATRNPEINKEDSALEEERSREETDNKERIEVKKAETN
jgi:hypothetical protein